MSVKSENFTIIALFEVKNNYYFCRSKEFLF